MPEVGAISSLSLTTHSTYVCRQHVNYFFVFRTCFVLLDARNFGALFNKLLLFSF